MAKSKKKTRSPQLRALHINQGSCSGAYRDVLEFLEFVRNGVPELGVAPAGTNSAAAAATLRSHPFYAEWLSRKKRGPTRKRKRA